MLGRMFFRSCCIRPLNLGDLMVEPRLPSSCVPSTAKTRAQQEYFIVLGPMLQNWQNVCLLVPAALGSQRERESERRKWNPNPRHSCRKRTTTQRELAQKRRERAARESEVANPTRRQVVFLSAWLFCKFTFVLYSHSNFSDFKIHCQNRISNTELRCKSFLTRANTLN